MNTLQLLLSINFNISSQSWYFPPIIKINNSYIKGKRVSFGFIGVNEYIGIPYAEPPVGQLRFQKPFPVESYPPFTEAVTIPAACPQFTKQPYPWYINSTHKCEDCLYLNIWTPAGASASNKKALMYWIHGGGYRYGSINSKLYSGIPLAALGDIIVVTVNYRLGPFGFVTSGTEHAPGNIGIWDVLEGLKWVNQNIKFFGGDSARITIAGESAGAITVGLLTISPLAKGLYSRLIMQSFSPKTRLADDNTLNIVLSQKIAIKVGCANDTHTIELNPKEVVQCLRGVEWELLSEADYMLAPLLTNDFFPQWGDELVPRNPRLAVEDGHFACKDLLIGNNRNEGSFFMTTTHSNLCGFFGKKSCHINISLGEVILREAISPFRTNPLPIVKHYLPENATTEQCIRQQVSSALSDMQFVCPCIYYAEKCSEQDTHVYYYFFTHRPSVTHWAEWMGVAHFEEVQFVFGQPLLNLKKYHGSDKNISLQIIEIWSGFVKNGF